MEIAKRVLYIATIFMLAAAIFGNCSSDKRIVDKLYKQRDYLLKEFKDKSIINRGKEFYQLSYYKKQSVNSFFFERKDGVLKLTNDSLQYPINETVPFTSANIMDSSNYSKVLSNELGRLLNVMDSLRINNVSSAFASGGIVMKIYLGDYKALVYVSDLAAVKNERWRGYITSGEKLDENWYFIKDEVK